MGMVAQQREEVADARSCYRSALNVAARAQITPVLLSVLAAVGDYLLSRGDVQVLGLRTLSAVLHHSSTDAQNRRRVLDSLARYGLSPQEIEPRSDNLEELVAALQTELAG